MPEAMDPREMDVERYARLLVRVGETVLESFREEEVQAEAVVMGGIATLPWWPQ